MSVRLMSAHVAVGNLDQHMADVQLFLQDGDTAAVADKLDDLQGSRALQRLSTEPASAASATRTEVNVYR